MITGVTSHKLDLVSTYDKNNPFQIGVNGVTNIDYTNDITFTAGNPNSPTNLTAITKVYYTIGNINYETEYTNDNVTIYVDNPYSGLKKRLNTVFKTSMSGYDFDDYPSIKEEAKMGLVFPPKVSNELFIERMSVSVFERHSRLSEIKTLEELIEYRNGYYNIIENR